MNLDYLRFETASAHHLEPLVAIGRDGEVQLCEGFHRTSIASVLELDRIPVNVLCRHAEWQRLRSRIATDPSVVRDRELPADPREHPNRRDLLSDISG